MRFSKIFALTVGLVLSLAVAGCADTPDSNQSASSETQTIQGQSDGVKPAKTAKENILAVDCEQLSQKACLNSAQCLLEQGKDKKYQCRAANNACESGFIQTEGMAKSTCDSAKSCKFVAASCFCPQGKQCICGGGAPAACQLLPAS